MKATKTIGILSIIAGIIMIVAGAITYGTVASQLKAENITVPGDSEFMGGAFAGKPVTGPLSAYAQADIINHHAL
ncbi:MAG: aromatic ring-opening dioxygenase LigA, partial [Propionibacteriaceae bacterium]|nr:aromatic ring-opening dioxygenase LigA [Propionibacteriaceae bacterium]